MCVTAAEKRKAVRDAYRRIIGRNLYSQSLRDYCYHKYPDGKYYSDCSSSICYAYKEAGLGFGILNTVGMWESKKLVDVDVRISKGIIQNPGALRVGDMLLFAGSDVSRSPWGYVGHVEMVGEISGGVVQLYGHGSGNPKRHEMNGYCRTRYNSKTSTALGNKGLIRVRRFIVDDGGIIDTSTHYSGSQLGLRVLRNGMVGEDVRELQNRLIALGYSCGSYGADGDFGDATERAVRRFQMSNNCAVDGEVGLETLAALLEMEARVPAKPRQVTIVGGDCYVRELPSKEEGKVYGAVREGSLLTYLGEVSDDGWLKVEFNGLDGWVSGKYGRLV